MTGDKNGSCAADNDDGSSDEQLMEHFSCDHCHPCFCELVRRYDEPVKKLVQTRYLAHNRSAVDDVAQETWLKVHRSHGTYKRGLPFRPWLFTIAANCALDFERSRNRHFAHNFSAIEPLENGQATFDPADPHIGAIEDWLEQDEILRRIIAVLNRLKEPEANVIRRAYLEGMTFAQAATDLGIPLGTLKTRINRVLQLFRDEVAGPEADVA